MTRTSTMSNFVFWGTTFACLLVAYVAVFLWKQRGLGGPKSWPILGSTVEHLRNFHRLHDWLLSYFERAPTITCRMPGGLMYYYTVDTENVKYMLKTNFKNFPKGAMFHERMEVLLGDGIFNTDGEKWKQQRKTASAEFSMRCLRDFNSVAFKDGALKLAGLLLQIEHLGLQIDMQDLFMRMTLDSIGKVGFGVDIGTLPYQLPLLDNRFAKAFDVANEIVTKRFVDPFWKLKRVFKIGSEAQLERSMQVIDSFTYGVICQRRLEMEVAKTVQSSARASSQVSKLDIITRFLELYNDGNSPTDCKMLRDLVLNFVIAGRDTTAVTLAWFVYSLTENPGVADRIYEELCNFQYRRTTCYACIDSRTKTARDDSDGSQDFYDEVSKFAELLNYDTLKAEELPYLHAVISETLRLFPAVPLDPKGILENDVLPDGTPLKKGGMISYSPYCMARMCHLWGADAKDFKPERWFEEGKFHPESEFKFTTFQAGLRTCLGKDSAYLQMKMTAAIICRFFEFKRVEGHHVHYRMMAILSMASGLHVTVKRRTLRPLSQQKFSTY